MDRGSWPIHNFRNVQEDDMKKQSTRLVATAALLGFLLSTTTPKLMAANRCKTKQVQAVEPLNGSSVSGGALLVVNKGGAHVLMQAENLTPGNAYTVWFVYFDDASKCVTPNHCAPVDLTTPAGAPEGVFGRMASAIAGPDGELTFQATLPDFEVSAGSAVHLALFSHGPANMTDLQERARQLLTPENPALGEPGLGLGTQKGFLVGAAMFDISSCR
jgi:hypothetical protein